MESNNITTAQSVDFVDVLFLICSCFDLWPHVTSQLPWRDTITWCSESGCWSRCDGFSVSHYSWLYGNIILSAENERKTSANNFHLISAAQINNNATSMTTWLQKSLYNRKTRRTMTLVFFWDIHPVRKCDFLLHHYSWNLIGGERERETRRDLPLRDTWDE